MKVLITGGAGFIGSNLVEYLLTHYNDGLEIAILDNLSTGRKANIEDFLTLPNIYFIESSILAKDILEKWVQWCDHCYHLAAPVGVKLIMEKPVFTVVENIRMIDNLMELICKYKKRVLIASSSEIYGRSLDFLDKTGELGLKEDDYRIEGSSKNHRWAYANAKSLAEFLGFAYYKEYETEVVIVRFFNIIGPKQLLNYGMVIPNFLQKALKGENIEIFGSGTQKRSFLHVKDAVYAAVELMVTGKGIGDVFNIGNPVELSMNELAEKVIEITQSNSKIIHISYEEAYGKGFEDMNRRNANIEKLQSTIPFKIQYDLTAIIKDIILAYKAEEAKKLPNK